MSEASPLVDRAGNCRAGEELDAGRVDAFLKARLPGLAGAPAIGQFPRGASNLTYLLRYAGRDLVLRRPPFGHKAKGAPGMLTRAEVIGHYAARTGLSVANFDFYEVFGLFRVAVIVQQIWRRYRDGATRDPQFAAFGPLVNYLDGRCRRLVAASTPGDWEWVMGVNFYGVTHAIRAFVPRMVAGGEEGHFAASASIAGLLSLPGMAAYNASKHAVVTVMEGLHHDLVLRGARVGTSVLCPSWVRTRISQSERNRTAGQATLPEDPDAITAKLVGAVREAVARGIEPAQVAGALFAAIESGRFYVLTHGDSKPGVKTRLEDILENRVPTRVRL